MSLADYNQYAPGMGQLAMQQPSVAGLDYRPPTKREQLEKMRAQLMHHLARVDTAIEALDAHPELETFINVLQEAGV